MRNPTLSSLPTYQLALALSLLCSCDSLWSGFAKDDPSSCGSKDSQVVCTFPKICNQVSGQCEFPSVIPQVGLEYESVAPNVVPFGGGSAIDVRGRGFTSNTIVKVAGLPLQQVVMNSAGDVIHGNVPRSPNRCGLVDISLSRPDGAQIQKEAQLRYVLEPLSAGNSGLLGNVPNLPNDILTANMDGDPNRRPDLIFSHDRGFSVLMNQLGQPPRLLDTSLPDIIAERIAVGRVTNLNLPDVVVFMPSAKQIQVYSNDGNSSKYSPTPSATFTLTDRAVEIHTTDLNRDGRDEIIASSVDGVGDGVLNSMSMSMPGGTLMGSTYVPLPGGGPLYVAIADFDGDSVPDVITASLAGLRKYSAIGPTLGPSVPYSLGGTVPGGIVAGDWDNDGKVDLAILHKDVSKVSFYRNETTFKLTATVPTLSGIDPMRTQRAQAVDVNCDGLIDLLVNRPIGASGSLSVLLNQGNGSFRPAIPINTQGYAGGPFLVLDLNQDTMPKLITRGNPTDSTSKVNISPLGTP